MDGFHHTDARNNIIQLSTSLQEQCTDETKQYMVTERQVLHVTMKMRWDEDSYLLSFRGIDFKGTAAKQGDTMATLGCEHSTNFKGTEAK